jgi:sortase A
VGLLCSRRWFEKLLLIAGIFCLGTAAAQIARYESFEHRVVARESKKPATPVITRLEIPRIGLTVAILEGDTSENMAVAAVHLTDTAPLGSSDGNAAIAGHRDSAFRDLGSVRPGDEIVIHAAKDFVYRVTATEIVNASDTSVLGTNGKGLLTLITCYPFHYIGSAPKRFVVQAELKVS